MLLILTVVLMLAALVLLILGLVDDTLGYIYGCIACSAAALLLLLAFGRLSRRRAVRQAAGGTYTTATVPATEPAGAWRPPAEPLVATPGAPTAVGLATDRGAAVEDDADWDELDDWDDAVFPIADYDDLLVAEIVPLLGELDPDELEDVRDREQAGKRRAGILRRLDVLAGPATDPARSQPATRPSPTSAVSSTSRPAGTPGVRAPAPAQPAAKVPAAAKAAAPKGAAPKAAAAKASAARPTVAKQGVAPAPAKGSTKKAPAATRAPGAKKVGTAKKAPVARRAPVAESPTPVVPAPASAVPPVATPSETPGPSRPVVGARRRPLPPRTPPVAG